MTEPGLSIGLVGMAFAKCVRSESEEKDTLSPNPFTNRGDFIMSSISKAIDQFDHVLGHSSHPAFVSIPLGAWTVSNICDGLALATGDDKYDDTARISMGIGLVGAAASVVTGLNDYSKIPKKRPSHKVATTHALGNSLVASLFVASYVMRVRNHDQGKPPCLTSRLLALAGGGLSMYTAWLGGKLVEEMGEAVQPAMKQMTEQEAHDEAHGRERLSPQTPLGKNLASNSSN